MEAGKMEDIGETMMEDMMAQFQVIYNNICNKYFFIVIYLILIYYYLHMYRHWVIKKIIMK